MLNAGYFAEGYMDCLMDEKKMDLEAQLSGRNQEVSRLMKKVSEEFSGIPDIYIDMYRRTEF